VADYSSHFNTFKEFVNIKQQHIQRDLQLYKTTLTAKQRKSISDYSGNDYKQINSSLLVSEFYDTSLEGVCKMIPEWNLKQLTNSIETLDSCFDIINAQPRIQYANGLLLYRNTAYINIKPKISGYDMEINLYDIKPGQLIKNIHYLSTSWTNKNKHLSMFVDNSQFRGCLFIIKAKSDEGMLVIGDNSQFPEEKEVIIDRRGGLLITNVDYKYIMEDCGSRNVLSERMIIEVDYIPESAIKSNTYSIYTGSMIATDYKASSLSDKDRIGETNIDKKTSLLMRDLGFPVYSFGDALGVLSYIAYIVRGDISDIRTDHNEDISTLKTRHGAIVIPTRLLNRLTRSLGSYREALAYVVDRDVRYTTSETNDFDHSTALVILALIIVIIVIVLFIHTKRTSRSSLSTYVMESTDLSPNIDVPTML
jgi:hypothetical protein